ncbi:MAG: EamA family transporter [candidate division Zixibacteria bacterium]|nr:EamA family transporter [candidate division Zixibacteria bacterium]
MDEFIGEIAALSTALCWAFTSVFFTLGGRRVGSVVVNRVRLLMALVFLSMTNFILYGNFIPIHAEPERWMWLGLSGIIGFIIGDGMLFQAFVVIGPRLSMLLMSLVPVISTLVAYFWFGETLTVYELAAMGITLAGISWVVSERNKNANQPEDLTFKQLLGGIALGIGGAAGQALGLLASKKGLGGGFPPLSANLIRVFVAGVLMWIYAFSSGRARYTISRLADKKATLFILGGSIFGPFVGVWLSLVAIDHARIGIASTLMALTPILIIPLAYWIFRDKLTLGAVFGTIVAVSGAVLLILM